MKLKNKIIAMINIASILSAAIIGMFGIDKPELLSTIGLIMIIAGIYTSVIVIKQK